VLATAFWGVVVVFATGDFALAAFGFGAETAAFTVFAAGALVADGLVLAGAGVFTFSFKEVLPEDAGFGAALTFEGEDLAGVVLIGFFFSTTFLALKGTLLFALAAGLAVVLADGAADFAVVFDLEVSFLAIFLLVQNSLQLIIIPNFGLFV